MIYSNCKWHSKNFIYQGVCIFICLFCLNIASFSQETLTFTRKFTKKLDKHGIEFYYPIERWLKLSDKRKDDFMTYDVVLHSPPDIEARIDIDKDHRRLYPNIEIASLLAHISTNDEDALIEYTKYPNRRAKEEYGADLVLYADFTPKESFSDYPNGRALILYKEGEALIKYIILYEQYLDPFFKLPLKFGTEEQG